MKKTNEMLLKNKVIKEKNTSVENVAKSIKSDNSSQKCSNEYSRDTFVQDLQ